MVRFYDAIGTKENYHRVRGDLSTHFRALSVDNNRYVSTHFSGSLSTGGIFGVILE